MLRLASWVSLALVLIALARSPSVRASPDQLDYTIRPLVSVGSQVGDQVIGKERYLWVVGYSDRGHLLFDPFRADGSEGEFLIQAVNAQFTTIVAPDAPAPDG